MKKLFAILLVVFGFQSFSQNQKCLTFSNDLIKDTKGKIINQSLSYDGNIYNIKVEVYQTFDINKMKMVCDTTNAKVSFDWKLNYDKNWEKQFVVGGKNVLITFYPNDKYLYFEFPK